VTAALKPLKWYRAMAGRKGRFEAAAFLVEGNRAIRQIKTSRPDDIVEIIATGEPPPDYRDYPSRLVTESQFRYISSNRTPQGILAVVRQPEGIYSDRLPEEAGNRVLLLEDIQDPGNTGTLIRTAAAFGFSGVIMTEKCADPLSPKCVQSTAGTVVSLWIRRTKDYLQLAQTLKDEGYTIVAADLAGMAGPEALKDRAKLMLALGNEAAGLSKELTDMADYRVQIPLAREKAESLNVAACGAILMYLSSV
jgi:TrmH family RNA methyltransferase